MSGNPTIDHLAAPVPTWATLAFADWRCRNSGLAERFEASAWRRHGLRAGKAGEFVEIDTGGASVRDYCNEPAYSRLADDGSVLYLTRNETLMFATATDPRMLPVAGAPKAWVEAKDTAAAAAFNVPNEFDPLQAAADRLKAAAAVVGPAIAECVRLGLRVSGSIGHKDNYVEFLFGYPGDEETGLQVKVYVPERTL